MPLWVCSLPLLEDRSHPQSPAVQCANGEFSLCSLWENSHLFLQTQAVTPFPKHLLLVSLMTSSWWSWGYLAWRKGGSEETLSLPTITWKGCSQVGLVTFRRYPVTGQETPWSFTRGRSVWTWGKGGQSLKESAQAGSEVKKQQEWFNWQGGAQSNVGLDDTGDLPQSK